MRVVSLPPNAVSPRHDSASSPDFPTPGQAAPAAVAFAPFGADAFAQARVRHVPVFLLIAAAPELPADPSLALQLSERTVPAEFISENGCDVTQAFVDWCRPLLGEELPKFVSFTDRR